MSQENVVRVYRASDSINPRDIDAHLALMHDDQGSVSATNAFST